MRRQWRRLAAAVLLLVPLAGGLVTATAAAAEAPAWIVDPAESRLSFSGTQGGAPFEGRFERFTADIRFDPADPATQRILIVIDAASLATGSRERDLTAKDADFLAVARYPEARLAVTSVRRAADGRYEASAELTLRGVTRPLALPFTLSIAGETARAAGEVSIDRVDFGVGQGGWASGDIVGRTVSIRFAVTARRSG